MGCSSSKAVASPAESGTASTASKVPVVPPPPVSTPVSTASPELAPPLISTLRQVSTKTSQPGETKERLQKLKDCMPSPAEIARTYIEMSHGSLPAMDYDAFSNLLSEDFQLTQEAALYDKPTVINVFKGWSSIVDGSSSVVIHTVAESGNTAIAHWETNYDVLNGQKFYGTDVDISGLKIRGFMVFASFTFNEEGKISRIHQRSDDLVRKMGIENEVREDRARRAASS